MKNIFLPTIFCSFFFFNFSFAQSVLKSTILFESGKYSLTNNAERQLESMFDSIKNYQINFITINGHTDNVGKKSSNEILSENRANRVRQFFLDKNLPIDLFQISSFDSQKPIQDNSTQNGKQQNRRVEIEIHFSKNLEQIAPNKPLITENKIASNAEPKLNSLDELFAELATQPTTFRIKTNRDTVIVGKDGTIIDIKANTFQSKSGYVNFSLKEDYSIDEMIADKLTTTTSNGKLLQSEGMINTTATDDDGNSLQPAADKSLVILMPTTATNPQAKLFDGEIEKNQVNWKLDSQELKNTATYNYPKKQLMQNANACSEDDLLKAQQLINKNGSNVLDDMKFTNPKLSAQTDRFFSQRETPLDCNGLKKLFAKYKVKNIEELAVAVKKEQMNFLFKQYGVTNEKDLNKKLAEEEKRMKDIAATQNVSYNIFAQNELGMRNCDLFSNFPGLKIIQKTDIPIAKNTLLFIIYKSQKSVVESESEQSKQYQFSYVPSGVELVLVGMKVENGKVFFGKKEIKSSRNIESLTFNESSADEIKKALKELR